MVYLCGVLPEVIAQKVFIELLIPHRLIWDQYSDYAVFVDQM